jgi:hypothetical protein
MALRFLTDHLAGDQYYRISRCGQNLDRCRTQIALMRAMDAQRDVMEESAERFIAHYAPLSA